MNKKTLFLILLGVIISLPVVVLGQVTATSTDPCATINAFKNITMEVGAAVVIIGWIITGILYLTAGGAPEKTGTAKKALIACVIGTIVIIVAPGAYDFVKGALSITGSGTLKVCP